MITPFLPEAAAAWVRTMQVNGAMSLLGLMVAWRVFPRFTDPLFALVLQLLHPDLSYS